MTPSSRSQLPISSQSDQGAGRTVRSKIVPNWAISVARTSSGSGAAPLMRSIVGSLGGALLFRRFSGVDTVAAPVEVAAS